MGTTGPYGDMSLPHHWQQCHCSVVRRLTPLPHRTGCVMSKAGEKTRRVIRERGAGGGVCDTPLPVFFHARRTHTELHTAQCTVVWPSVCQPDRLSITGRFSTLNVIKSVLIR